MREGLEAIGGTEAFLTGVVTGLSIAAVEIVAAGIYRRVRDRDLRRERYKHRARRRIEVGLETSELPPPGVE